MDAVMDMEPAICAVTKAESIENTDVITMRNINKSYRMGTVSYTHLDVYKRQT